MAKNSKNEKEKDEKSVEESGVLLLHRFLKRCRKDARIGVLHMGIYAALLQLWMEQGGTDPCEAFGKKMMDRSKIGSSATYHKAIRLMAEAGYIDYRPSFYQKVPSKYYLQIDEL